MSAKNVLLFLAAVVILQIANATESKSVVNLIQLDEHVIPREFKCPEEGIYPDLEDCLKYHICIPNDIPTPENEKEIFVRAATDTPATCSNGLGYDPKTGRCSLKLENGKCPEIAPKCQSAYQMGPLNSDPSLYFVCVPSETGLVQELYICPVDTIHNGTTCVSNAPPTGLDSNGLCIKAGAFYHPNDCTKHRDCTGPGANPVEKKCAAYNKFNWKTEKCELFNCDNHGM